jgi:enoyl-CoA hydratase
MKPVVAKIQGAALGGGSDLALACDITFIEDTAKFGYPPSRIWGCPTTAFWFYRLGMEKAKRVLFTGQILSGREAVDLGLLGQASSSASIEGDVCSFLDRIVTVPANQLWYSKQMINHAVEESGLLSTQRLATIFDGMSRHSPEGVAFQQRAKDVGFKKAVRERDSGQETLWSDLRKK